MWSPRFCLQLVTTLSHFDMISPAFGLAASASYHGSPTSRSFMVIAFIFIPCATRSRSQLVHTSTTACVRLYLNLVSRTQPHLYDLSSKPCLGFSSPFCSSVQHVMPLSNPSRSGRQCARIIILCAQFSVVVSLSANGFVFSSCSNRLHPQRSGSTHINANQDSLTTNRPVSLRPVRLLGFSIYVTTCDSTPFSFSIHVTSLRSASAST